MKYDKINKIRPESNWQGKVYYKIKHKSKQQKMRRFTAFYLSDSQIYELDPEGALLQSFTFGKPKLWENDCENSIGSVLRHLD